MKYFYRFLLQISIILLFSACSILQPEKEKTEKSTEKVSLAGDLQPKLHKDTTTITFEESFFDEIPEGVQEVDLDELYASFENIPDENLPVFTAGQTAAQVNAMSGAVAIKYNPRIQEYINRFTSKRGRKYISKMLALSQLYFPIFEKILEEEGVPKELKYAAVVESALMPNVMSRAGAVGLWQFMRGTGKQYGLEINSSVDERCGIFASTRASARYMRSLYEVYKDWLMVLAAYNCGPGNVNKAIVRSGGTDFWSIYEHLPRETRRHIPKYIATFYTFHYHTDLMIAPVRDKVKYTNVRSVSVNKPVHLAQVAKVLGLEEKDIAALNREYLRGYIPAKQQKSYSLILPDYESHLYAALQDSIYGYNRSQYFAQNGKFIGKRKTIYPFYGSSGTGSRISYKVRRGDVLGKIARRHGTTVRNIKKWNGLRSDKIRIGQRLVLYASGRQLAQKQKTYKAPASRDSKVKNPKLRYLPNEYVYHTVQKNENCWSIAKKYEGVTQRIIMEMNQISNPSSLRIGQKLRIKEKG